ncbi:hypothetical protein [Candidatus Phytoplasma meliae]|uniref:Uncharacterized protein n=1 Tax=Candidatus Phytoplasma meliae TaxID=1848402 RepID=A0ABS5CYK7_9MOLU|nr:hypothetical protein [Candidatus Phytoplasma meliae]MBP5836055.1 hypothetical protein [Candidatus Phytoplasma meliae]
MKIFFNFDLLKYLFTFLFSFKYFFFLLYDLFYNIFLTKSSFLFNYEVGWNKNFIIIFNFTKMIFIFIWEQLTTLIYPLKLFSSLFNFLIDILLIFKEVFVKIKDFISMFVTEIFSYKKFDADNSWWEKLVEVVKLIFSVTIGGLVIYFMKEIQAFILAAFSKIGDLLFKIVLRILDIFVIVLKIWLLLLKNVIIILSFVLSFLINIIYLYVFDDNKNNALIIFNN